MAKRSPTSTPGRPGAPAALFVHGVLVNADLWRNVIFDVADLRRCIAPDLPAHGATPAGSPDADLSLNGLAAHARRAVRDPRACPRSTSSPTTPAVRWPRCSRPAIPRRIRTLTLTNCDVHDNFPPEPSSRSWSWPSRVSSGPMVAAMAGDRRSRPLRSRVRHGYAHPDRLPDELLTSYLGPFVADEGKGLERFLTASSAAELMAIEPLLAELRAPAQVAWGTADLFFEPAWADRLWRAMIPGVERVTLVPDAMLFWPDEQAADLVPSSGSFWEVHG